MKKQHPRLEQLALQAQSQPRQSTERQKAVTKLMSDIKKSGLLDRTKENYPREIYSDALSETILHICLNIDLYDSAKSNFATWISQILETYLQETINSSTK